MVLRALAQLRPRHLHCQDDLSLTERGLQRSAVQLYQIAGDGEAKTRTRRPPRAGPIPPVEPLEEPRKLLRLNVGRSIPYFDAGLFWLPQVEEGVNTDLTARRRELEGVVKQVLKSALQLRSVCGQGDAFG